MLSLRTLDTSSISFSSSPPTRHPSRLILSALFLLKLNKKIHFYLELENSWQFFMRFLCGASVHLNFDRHVHARASMKSCACVQSIITLRIAGSGEFCTLAAYVYFFCKY